MFNHSNENLEINIHDRVAQLIIEKINTNELIEVSMNDLNKTERGEAGFGSTGN